jgi:hypothetical protein
LLLDDAENDVLLRRFFSALKKQWHLIETTREVASRPTEAEIQQQRQSFRARRIYMDAAVGADVWAAVEARAAKEFLVGFKINTWFTSSQRTVRYCERCTPHD